MTAPHSPPTEPVLLRSDTGGICTLTLNRPKQFNALSEELLGALQSAFNALAGDRSVRVVVLEAAGKAFCAGHDLKQMRATPSQEYYDELFAKCSAMMLSIVNLPKPVIAKVQGVATAAGCQLVGTCDLAVASTDAQFAVSGIDVGLFCSTPSVALSRNVPRKRAFEMLVTGEFISAQTALEYGLVNAAVTPQALDGAVIELASRIQAKSQTAVETGKRMFYRQLEKDLGDAYRYAGHVMACNMMAGDASEGIDAFIEKRTPTWSNG